MTTLAGDVLEELTELVYKYNKALLEEKGAAALKKIASDDILVLLKHHQCSRAEAGGCTLTVKPWTRETVDITRARSLLSPDQLAQLVKTSTGISLDVKPLRVQ